MRLFNLCVIVIILCLYGCKQPDKATGEVKQNETDYNVYFNQLTREYGKEKVLLAVYFTTACMSDFKKNHNAQAGRICSLQEDLVNYYSSKEESIKKCILMKDSLKVLKWCLTDKKLNKIDIRNEGNDSFEEILFTMKKGRKFFSPFLKDSSQYYGSLDFEQSCALYFNVVLFLANAPEEENGVFFKEYYNTYEMLQRKK